MTTGKIMIVHKCNHYGESLVQYNSTVLQQNDTEIVVEAFFAFDAPKDYHNFKKGDRMIEWFYTDRWFNIFELHHHETDALEGWYCNITRPAIFTDDAIMADDLALDLMVYPDGSTVRLDEDEFDTLDIDASVREQALQAMDILLAMVERREGPFKNIEQS